VQAIRAKARECFKERYGREPATEAERSQGMALLKTEMQRLVEPPSRFSSRRLTYGELRRLEDEEERLWARGW
jgi:hypothetical protein